MKNQYHKSHCKERNQPKKQEKNYLGKLKEKGISSMLEKDKKFSTTMLKE